MVKKSSPFSLNAFVVSLREFARNASIRNQALEQERPLIVEQSRDHSFFILLPPPLYNKLYELYRDMRDSHDLSEAMKKETKWSAWEDTEIEFLSS